MTPNEYIRKLQNKPEPINFTQDSEYIRLFGDDESEEFMESVYKKELGSNFEKVDSGVGIGKYEEKEEKEEKEERPSPMPPKSPFS